PFPDPSSHTYHEPRTTNHEPLTRWHRLGLVALAGLVVAFGYLVVRRAAFQDRPMTDLQVYLRAAWAVRNGADPNTISDDNNWHYHSRLLLPLAMAPLADAPPGADRAGLLPFGVSAALWYAFGVACLCFAVHRLASALEETAAGPAPRGGRRW